MKDQKDRKGMNNKGFSFVELIIAIAILAIMAGVLAPQLIKYIDSSRKSTDVQNAQAIATAVNIALANEEAYNAAKNTAVGTSNQYVVSDLSTTGDKFEEEILEILGTNSASNLSKPKFNASKNTSFVIVFKLSGSSLSFEIYPIINATQHSSINQLYPNVGTDYTD